MEENKVRQIIAKNLIYYRKEAGLTQSELAAHINYTDKSVSKWERAEGTPDVFVLSEIAKLYNITVNDLLSVEHKRPADLNKQFKLIVSLLSASIVWLVAVIAFVLAKLITPSAHMVYLSFIFAVPVSAIVLLVFNMLWGRRITTCILISIITWGFLTGIYLCFENTQYWLIYIIGAPIQVLAILWYFLRFDLRKLKKKFVKNNKVKEENPLEE